MRLVTLIVHQEHFLCLYYLVKFLKKCNFFRFLPFLFISLQPQTIIY